MHYVERGPSAGGPASPTVVLIHGKMGTAYDFTMTPLVDALAARHRVIVVDRPGCGYSRRLDGLTMTVVEQARIIRGLLSALGTTRPTVVGHSFGGAVALADALEFPDRAAGYVLLAPAAYPVLGWEASGALLRSPQFVQRLVRAGVRSVTAALAAQLLKTVFAPAPVPEAFARHAMALGLRPTQFANELADWTALPTALREMSTRYGEIRTPVVIVAGDEDTTCRPDAHAKVLQRELPNARLVLVPQTGHMVHVTALERVQEAIASLTGASRSGPKSAGHEVD